MEIDEDVEKTATALRARVEELTDKLATESAIVDRVWKALGMTTYEDCKPFAIDEHVTNLREQVAQLQSQLEQAREGKQ